ncbi:40S ribosomal protein S8 [Spraguea lophii 42_110]|uniref:40S ribosomal protein S8 n=1 Tax=Spraguea lophii (strain 42_110) TaxID=1358809 RepID=S7XGW2_SPRLO|nr:Chain SI0, 40S ribosomal protein S8 [Spraguea lophii 42_110]7QJH_RI0 Chain RI0, 40S ribosomal protein S8 [Spraguea lophii 42_110]7QJH_SI0 Chain SI0, 40S ribosomal protein S8 [Spraguea lophii 42_110]8BR3_SI0 Chain SI0, 40S ribosomal protein S8 [Spraguea lophii 42_110]8P5D_SI0 Chain SI0, 40S ribosomal protein S8 [Spraguea lophii 42_110]8P60_RI0 Chain RI0, 40S ribosomal protein S8 [Spraguea lophii 42_110]8P60_SI0 Chain SI0, 40S ribosomal protein S8 [Spraguea lophii 42_110]EPR78289.1 40S ribo
MGISRSNRHKRKETGGKKGLHEKKRKNNCGRPPSNTRIGERRVKQVRVRGGNIKHRALRLDTGNIACKTHNFTLNTSIQNVMYHPSNNEFMRTNILTKSAVVKINGQPFKHELEKDQQFESKDPVLFDNLRKGNCYAIITSRPGQVGMADGYLLQGEELKFYMEKFKKKSVKV